MRHLPFEDASIRARVETAPLGMGELGQSKLNSERRQIMKAVRYTITATLLLLTVGSLPARAADISPVEARAIAKEAYVYGLAPVMGYKAIYEIGIKGGSPDHQTPFNQIKNEARLYTPEDKAIVAPNSDTPYSFAYLDLRAEPVVLSTPQVEPNRYFSIQLIDLYTHNFAYIGTRTTGSAEGSFLIAGPEWKGEAPKGISRVMQSETPFAVCIYRTQLSGPYDMENVKKVQAGYKVRTLSQFLGIAAPSTPPGLIFPVWDEKKLAGIGFFEYLDFVLRLCPVHPSERAIRKRFASISVGGGPPFDAAKLSPEMKSALIAGIAEGSAAIRAKNEADIPFVDMSLQSMDVFGSRDQLEAAAKRLNLKNIYLLRTNGALYGLFGNTAEEAVYPNFMLDSEGRPLDGAKHQYRLRLPPDKLLPAKAFWSVTMYDGVTFLLVANPINRYLINSPMLPSLKRDADGGLTLIIQHDSPGKDKESNWLPAPSGPFRVTMRLYLPEPEVLEHNWKMPPLDRVK